MNNESTQAKVVAFGELLLRMSVTNGFRFTQANEMRIQTGGAESNIGLYA
ncbi:hypothetical protein [Flavobacterium sp. LM5]|nr:hypothetical protein [Flavobacterium sp. LM5]